MRQKTGKGKIAEDIEMVKEDRRAIFVETWSPDQGEGKQWDEAEGREALKAKGMSVQRRKWTLNGGFRVMR